MFNRVAPSSTIAWQQDTPKKGNQHTCEAKNGSKSDHPNQMTKSCSTNLIRFIKLAKDPKERSRECSYFTVILRQVERGGDWVPSMLVSVLLMDAN